MPDHIKKRLEEEIKVLERELTTELPAEILDEGGGANTRTSHERAASVLGPANRIAREKIIDQIAAALVLESFLAARSTRKQSS